MKYLSFFWRAVYWSLIQKFPTQIYVEQFDKKNSWNFALNWILSISEVDVFTRGQKTVRFKTELQLVRKRKKESSCWAPTKLLNCEKLKCRRRSSRMSKTIDAFQRRFVHDSHGFSLLLSTRTPRQRCVDSRTLLSRAFRCFLDQPKERRGTCFSLEAH